MEVVTKKDKKEFRLQGKSLFLTYPRCPATLPEFLESLKVCLETGSNQIKEFALSLEEHQDGTPHLHAYIVLAKKFSTCDQTRLAITVKGVEYKGNYQTGKNKTRIMEYLLKDKTGKDDPRVLISTQLRDRISDNGEVETFAATALRLAREGRIKEALQLMESESPLDFLKNRDKYNRTFHALRAEKVEAE